jgi:hypothetical protein
MIKNSSTLLLVTPTRRVIVHRIAPTDGHVHVHGYYLGVYDMKTNLTTIFDIVKDLGTTQAQTHPFYHLLRQAALDNRIKRCCLFFDPVTESVYE